MATSNIKRKITFVAWADASDKQPFDFEATSKALAAVKPTEQVFPHGDELTSVDHVSPGSQDKPTRLQLLKLHDDANAPSDWGPGSGATRIQLAAGRYAAFLTHVMIWPDKIAAFDQHANAPGLGRLASYIKGRTGERVVFRALYEQDLKEQLEDLAGYRTIEYGIHDPHKKTTLDSSGMVGSLLARSFQKVPSVRVRFGMGRKGRRDAYLPDELHDELLKMSDAAEEYFDSLIISGPSKTQTTPTGKPRKIDVNLLSKRLGVDVEIARDRDAPSLPKRADVFKAAREARAELDRSGALAAAVEARLALAVKD